MQASKLQFAKQELADEQDAQKAFQAMHRRDLVLKLREVNIVCFRYFSLCQSLYCMHECTLPSPVSLFMLTFGYMLPRLYRQHASTASLHV